MSLYGFPPRHGIHHHVWENMFGRFFFSNHLEQANLRLFIFTPTCGKDPI